MQTAVTKFERIATTIEASVVDQHAANSEIDSNMQQVALGTKSVSKSILQVGKAASETSDAARAMHDTASDVSKRAEELHETTRAFLLMVRGKS